MAQFCSTIVRHLECAIQTELVVELEVALIERKQYRRFRHNSIICQQARIQDSERGGGFVHSEGGGGVRTGISGADPNCCRALGKSTSKKKLQTAVGGGGG